MNGLSQIIISYFQRKFLKIGGNYPLIFTLSDQSYDFKNYFLKFRLYMTQSVELQKKSETF